MKTFEFQQTFDGSQPELTAAEKALAFIALSTAVYASFVRHSEAVSVDERDGSRMLELETFLGPAGTAAFVTIDYGKRQLHVIAQHVGQAGGGGQLSTYHADGDAKHVLRYGGQEENLSLSFNESADDSLFDDDTMSVIANAIAGYELTEQLGMDGQPVGVNEVNNIVNLLQYSHPS